MAEQLGHANPELTLRVYAHALPVEGGDMGFADFGLASDAPKGVGWVSDVAERRVRHIGATVERETGFESATLSLGSQLRMDGLLNGLEAFETDALAKWPAATDARGIAPERDRRSERLPVEVRVGPQVLTINHGSTFMITDLSGEIAPHGSRAPNTPAESCSASSNRTCGAAGGFARSRQATRPTTRSNITEGACGPTTTASSRSASSATLLGRGGARRAQHLRGGVPLRELPPAGALCGRAAAARRIPHPMGANVPQAWAAGCVFHLLQAILVLEADAPRQRLYIEPEFPRWLPDLTLRGLSLGPAKVDLRFQREADEKTRWDASVREGFLEVEERPRGRQETR